jgi:hypothetical protein
MRCIRCGCWYAFHLDRRRKSMKSTRDWRRPPCRRYQTTWANGHNKARCRRGGQKWKCGRRVHSSEMCLWSVRSIIAILRRVHCQKAAPSLHSGRRCCKVSTLPEFLQTCLPVELRLIVRLFVWCHGSRCTRQTWFPPVPMSRVNNAIFVSSQELVKSLMSREPRPAAAMCCRVS